MPAKTVIFLIGSALTYVLGLFVLRQSRKWGFLDHPGERKLQKEPVPYGGGLLIFGGILLQVLLALLVYLTLHTTFRQYFPEVHFDAIFKDVKGPAIFLGALAMLGLGLWDDLSQLSPFKKLFLQALVTLLVLVCGKMSMSFFVPIPWLGLVGTTLWVLLITNAFNLIDNMDGYCGGVSLVVLGLHLLLLNQAGHFMVEMVSLVCMASVFAFLCFNKPPAKLYLGDSGSHFLGFLIAMLSVLSTYHREGQEIVSVLTPLFILAVPLFDVASVVWIRIKNKKPWYIGDRNHFSHRLLALGLSETQSLGVILGLTMLCGLGGLMLQYVSHLVALMIFAFMVLVFLLIYRFESWSLRKNEQGEVKP